MTGRSWWVYVVLTFDRASYATNWDAFRDAGRCWDHGLRQALRHAFPSPLTYLQTWERHRDGFPHVNLLLAGDALRAAVEDGGIVAVRRRSTLGKFRTHLLPRAFRRWLNDAAVRAGFGNRVWCEVLAPQSTDAMAGYLVKHAAELTGSAGKHGDQSPVLAPKGFRRLRASRGLLPPLVQPSDELTGTLLTTGYAAEFARRRDGVLDSGPRVAGARVDGVPVSWEFVDERLAEIAQQRARDWRAKFEPEAGEYELDAFDQADVDLGSAFPKAKPL